ncbi:MAG: trypsin-like serine protease [Candidatus Aenigmarchaeota archaeon]|nr:trypsin-like serine protease [Candidatus Aenigmarchaeota archaeon]
MKTESFVLVVIACFIGGLMGSFFTIALFFPVYSVSTQSPNPTTVVERVYVNESIQLQDRVIDILQNNKDSVVHVNVVKYTQTPFGILRSEGSGSGFIVSEDGYVVTNEHVVSDASEINVVLYNDEEFQATLRGADPLNDVAVIKINPPYNLKPVEIGDSDGVREGEFVVAIGSPFRLQNTITLGIVSALNRTLTSEGGFRIEKVIQTDAAVNPGNSGGPLIDLEGKVVGVNTAIISTSGGSEGIGFSIPINTVKGIYTELIESGKIARPFIGITGTDVTKAMVSAWDLGVDYGVLVIDFSDRSSAKEAGLRETFSRPGRSDFILGDIIVSINGDKITNNVDLLNVLLKYKPGDTVEMEVYRDGSFLKFSVMLGERPEGM